MNYENSHPSRQELLRRLEGELPARDSEIVREHVEVCEECRALSRDLENALADLVHVFGAESAAPTPDAAGPRALLKARLAEMATSAGNPGRPRIALPHGFAWGAAACAVLALGVLLSRWNPPRPQPVVVSIPDPALTPGATVLASRQAVCAHANPNNKDVPVALQRKVFQEYGLAGADPRAYEVDYLVTPALGGAEDIHNLWPHSYSATVWNARVKDALEDRLYEMVCDGSLDLTEAQREIAQNWIGAYKKYFHTDEPLAEHNSPVRP
jgi:hypothetical protein